MYYIGLISGTSMDAIDTALLDITDTSINLVSYNPYPIDDQLHIQLKNINEDTPIKVICKLDCSLGKNFAAAAVDILASNNLDKSEVVAIGSHGQTVFHNPEQPDACTLQIADANIIANTTGITTVTDFRRMDMAAGGQGAPLAPVIHKILFQKADIDNAVINIGGMANITFLPSSKTNVPVTGYDTGPGNVLLDEWIYLHKQKKYDENGSWGATGTPDFSLLEHLMSYDYFTMAPPKSTGRDEFNIEWLQQQLSAWGKPIKDVDVQATLIKFTAFNIAIEVKRNTLTTKNTIICGGGAHNSELVNSLQEYLPETQVCPSSELGYDPDAIEAMCFAWLAKCRLDEITGNIASVTGANTTRILGAVYLSS